MVNMVDWINSLIFSFPISSIINRSTVFNMRISSSLLFSSHRFLFMRSTKSVAFIAITLVPCLYAEFAIAMAIWVFPLPVAPLRRKLLPSILVERRNKLANRKQGDVLFASFSLRQD